MIIVIIIFFSQLICRNSKRNSFEPENYIYKKHAINLIRSNYENLDIFSIARKNVVS